MLIHTKDAGNLAISMLKTKMQPIQQQLEQDEAFSFLDYNSNIRHAAAIAVTFGGRVILMYAATRPYHEADGTVLFAEEVSDNNRSAVNTAGGDAGNYLKQALSAMEKIPMTLDAETIDYIISAYNDAVGMDQYNIKHRIAAYHWFGVVRTLDGYSKEVESEPEW